MADIGCHETIQAGNRLKPGEVKVVLRGSGTECSAFPKGGESKTLPAALRDMAVGRAALARGQGEARGIQSSCGSICGAKSFPTTELAALGNNFIFHQLFPHGDLLSILQTASRQPLGPSCHFTLSSDTNAKRLLTPDRGV